MKYVRRWPWVGQQEWHDILFMHWPVPYEILKPYVPAPFKLETYNGQAWVTVILFQAKNSRLRGMPTSMSYPPFLQMNTRTYIQFDGEPGIYFFSVDVNRLLTVAVAKRILKLPYKLAEMEMAKNNDHILFKSKRIKSSHSSTGIVANYQPSAERIANQQGTLPYWLTERYCFWMIKGSKIIKGPLSHSPWELYDVTFDLNMTAIIPFIPAKYSQVNPSVHYAKSIHAYLHPFEQSGIYRGSP